MPGARREALPDERLGALRRRPPRRRARRPPRRAGRPTTPWRRRSPARPRRPTAAARGTCSSRSEHARRDRGPAARRSSSSSHVRRRQVEHALELERRQLAVLAEHERADRRSCAASRSCCPCSGSCRRRARRPRRRRRARRTRPADSGCSRRRAGPAPRGCRRRSPTRSATGSSRPACCAPRRRAPCGGSRRVSASSCRIPANWRFVVERLMLITSKPCSTAQRRPAEQDVPAAGEAGAEHADARELAVRRERADDPGAGRPVAAEVALRVLGDHRPRRPRRRETATACSTSPDERMAALDAAVEDADADALARRVAPRPLARDLAGPLDRQRDRPRPPRRAGSRRAAARRAAPVPGWGPVGPWVDRTTVTPAAASARSEASAAAATSARRGAPSGRPPLRAEVDLDEVAAARAPLSARTPRRLRRRGPPGCRARRAARRGRRRRSPPRRSRAGSPRRARAPRAAAGRGSARPSCSRPRSAASASS